MDCETGIMNHNSGSSRDDQGIGMAGPQNITKNQPQFFQAITRQYCKQALRWTRNAFKKLL